MTSPQRPFGIDRWSAPEFIMVNCAIGRGGKGRERKSSHSDFSRRLRMEQKDFSSLRKRISDSLSFFSFFSPLKRRRRWNLPEVWTSLQKNKWRILKAPQGEKKNKSKKNHFLTVSGPVKRTKKNHDWSNSLCQNNWLKSSPTTQKKLRKKKISKKQTIKMSLLLVQRGRLLGKQLKGTWTVRSDTPDLLFFFLPEQLTPAR